MLSRNEGAFSPSHQNVKSSTDPHHEEKKNQVLRLHETSDGKAEPGEGDPDVVIWHQRIWTHERPHGVRTCSRATTCRPTGSTRTSRSTNAGTSSWPSCAHCTCLPNESPPSWTTTDRTGPQGRNQGLGLGCGKQCRTRLRTVLRLTLEPDLTPVHRFALLRPLRNRSRQPPRIIQHDPPLDRTAEPPHHRPPCFTRSSTGPKPSNGQRLPDTLLVTSPIQSGAARESVRR